MEISFEDVCFSYHDCQILRDITFKVKKGEVLGIFGPSGSGKTTLFFLICGLLSPASGRILIDGANAFALKDVWQKTRKSMGVAFQFPEDMFFKKSIAEEFMNALKDRDYTREEEREKARNFLEWAGLDMDALWERDPLSLSQGQLRRLSLAIVCSQKRDLLIMDEPTVGLECLSQKSIIRNICDLSRKEGKTCILLTHSPHMLLPFIDKCIVLKDGRMTFQGSREDLFQDYGPLYDCGLSLPSLAALSVRLKEHGLPIDKAWQDLDQASSDLIGILRP